MIKKLAELFVLGSISVFAQSKSDFERGYAAGRLSCKNNTEYSCLLTKWIRTYMGYGGSKSEALEQASSRCKDKWASWVCAEASVKCELLTN